jgi:uncharacterized cupredoxin-like copper-binding protein
MKSRKLLIIAALAILIIPVLSACGPAKIDAALTTYKITLDKNSAPAGDIIFHVHNDATDLKHEFVIFKTDLPEDQLPTNDDGTVNEDGEGVTHIDEVELEPGESSDLEVNLDKGKYVLICNIDSDEMHYQHGMHVAFTVK